MTREPPTEPPVPRDDAGELIPGPDMADLGGLTRRGAAWSTGLMVVRYAVSIGVTAVLSRMLSPLDYGLVGMVVTLTALLQLVADMGLSWATIQRAELTRGQMDNLWWANSGFGAILWGLAAASGPALAWFYGRRELTAIAAVMGSVFLLGGLAVQPMALLKRRMLFGRLSAAELGSSLVGAGVGLAAALILRSYWALVWQSVAAQAARMLFIFAASGYRPGRPRRGQGTVGLLKFGGGIVASSLAVYLYRNLDHVLIGHTWGPEALAFYNRAYFLMMLPAMVLTGALAQVLSSALCALQNDRERFERTYITSVRMLALAATPVAAGLMVMADEAVRVVYGPQWGEVAPLLRMLSVVSLVSPVTMSVGWLFVATGQVGRMWRWTEFSALVTCAAFFVGLRWGPRGVAASFSAATALLALPCIWYGARTAGIRTGPVLWALGAPLLSSAVCVAAVWGVGSLGAVSAMSLAGAIPLKVAAGALAYLAASLVVQRQALLGAAREVATLLRGRPGS